MAAALGIVGLGLATENQTLVPLLLGAGSYWIGVALNATVEAETHRQVRDLPAKKRWLCRVEGIEPRPAEFSFRRMLLPGILLMIAGAVWAVVTPARHQASWGTLLFFGLSVSVFSLWLRRRPAA